MAFAYTYRPKAIPSPWSSLGTNLRLFLCQSRLHSESENFVSHKKKNWIMFDFMLFLHSVTSILIGKDDEYKKPHENFGLCKDI